MAAATPAGKAFVELFADDSKLARGLKSAQKRLQGFAASVQKIGKTLSLAGSAVGAPLIAAAQSFAAAGTELDKASKNTGWSVEALSEMQHAAEKTGVSFGAITSGASGLNSFMTNLKMGAAGARGVLLQLGVDAAEFAKLSPDEQFRLMAEALSRVPDRGRQAALATQVFGGAAGELLPLLRQGAGGIAELRSEAQRLGVTMSGEDAAAAREFSTAVQTLWSQIKSLTQQVGAGIAKALTPWITKTQSALATAIAWVESHRGLIVAIGAAAAAVTVAGTAIVGLALAFKVAALAVGGLILLVKALGVMFAFLLSPLGLIALALAGVVAWAFKTGVATDWLKSTFGPLAEQALESFGAIKEALAAGDFGAAAQVLWTTLKYWWSTGINWLTGLWIDFKRTFLEIFFGMTSEASKILTNVWAAFQAGMIKGMQMLEQAQGGVANKLLRMAGEEGFMGNIARLIVGDDLRGKNIEDYIETSNDMTAGKNAARQRQLQKIEEDRQASLQEIEDGLASDMAGMNDAFAEQADESAQAVERARAEMDEAIAAARATGERGAGSGAPGGVTLPDLPELAGMVNQGTKNLQLQGSFSGDARQFSPGPRERPVTEDTAMKQLKQLQDLTTNTGKINAAVENGLMVG